MDVSPFPYQGPLEPALVRGRDELIHDLIGRITERRVTALLGPRRFGKTSLLRRVAADLTEVTTIWVDLYEVTSMADVVVRFDNALGAVQGRYAEMARRISAELSIQLGLVGVKLAGPPSGRPEPGLALQQLLQVLVQAAQAGPTLLVIDEFSSISRVDGAAGALRTALQHHYGDLGIVFAGSHPSMMRTLFTDRPQPFFAQADLLNIGPLDAVDIEDMIADGFRATDRRAGRLGSLITGFSGGHPQRTMQLADACWRRTPEGGDGDQHWADGLADVRQASTEWIEWLYSRFSGGEQDVLRVVARSGSVYGREAAILELSKGSATHARQRLIDEGDMWETPAGLRLVDPLMADWLRNRFPI
ncbi:MAG TPA: AAA family ATPase [Acidimicrobiales bacterium]|jgi:hypothetical protein|nr:AAA family ATPase [Acidimicrobiales bacterium]